MEDRLIDIGVKELVSYIYRDTLVPDLFELLGEEQTMEVIQVFGGTKINIPPYKKFVDMRRNLEIFETLAACNCPETKRSLADKYHITEVWVEELYKIMKGEANKIRRFLEVSRQNQKIEVTTQRQPREKRS